MKKSLIARLRQFLQDSYTELAQCVWPDRAQLFESTLLVVMVILVLAVFVWIVDTLGSFVVGGITTGQWGF